MLCLPSRWSSDTSQRSGEDMLPRVSSNPMSEGTLTIAHASPDKSRLKERVRQAFCRPALLAHPLLHCLMHLQSEVIRQRFASYTCTAGPFPTFHHRQRWQSWKMQCSLGF